MATPSLNALRAAAKEVLGLPSITPIEATETAALAAANVGAPISPAATVNQLYAEIDQLITQSPTEIASIKTEEVLKQNYNQLGPKMTTAQRLALTPPADAIVRVYDTTVGAPYYWNGTMWVQMDNTPASFSRKVVVIGSSVAAGASASSYANSYAGIWGTQLASLGVVFENVAVSGTNTDYWVTNFYTKVGPHTPDVIFIGLALWNEGLGNAATPAEKDVVYARWITNIAKLAAMAKEIGARVIVGGNYPNNNYTTLDYQYLKQSYNDLAEMGLQVINFLGTVDDGTGKWRTGMWADALHPNDVGHAAMAGALSPGLFSRHETTTVTPRVLATQATGRGIDMDNAVNFPMIVIKPDVQIPIRSFTVGFRMRKQTGPSGVVVPFCTAAPDLSRIRNPGSPGIDWFFSSNGQNVMTGVVPDYLWHHYAIGFDYHTNTSYFWIDGVLVGTLANSTANLGQYLDGAALMGRPENNGFNVVGGISDVTIHRYRLRTDEVLMLANGNIPTTSLDLYCPLNDPLDTLGQYGRPGNAGWGNSYLQVQSDAAVTRSTDSQEYGRKQVSGQLVVTSVGTPNPGNPKAVVALDSTTQGFSPPRMTQVQRDAISPGATDFIIIYNTTTNKYEGWTGAAWAPFH